MAKQYQLIGSYYDSGGHDVIECAIPSDLDENTLALILRVARACNGGAFSAVNMKIEFESESEEQHAN